MFWKRKPKIQPEKLIIGLGNPGAKYEGTRHNVGFDVVRRLAHELDIDLKQVKHKAQFGIGKQDDVAVAIAMPLTYMNLSGNATRDLMAAFQIAHDNILVIADDLDLPVGRVRMRLSGSAGGHKGHISIIEKLKTKDYARIRIGIGKGGETIDHVLGKFSREESDHVASALERAVAGCKVWLSEGPEPAQRFVNAPD